jgi:lipid-A-disaccharide synthase
MTRQLKIFIITGEESGDMLAARVVEALKNGIQGDQSIELLLFGVGGKHLTEQGLNSLFDFKELSIMGFVDVAKKIFKLKKLIKITANKIASVKPDIVLTVDSGGFCFRVVKLAKDILQKNTKDNNIKFYHYIAPAVWAYGEERGLRLKKLYDKIFCLYNFEPSYFTKYELDAICVGTSFNYNDDAMALKETLSQKYLLNKPILAVTLGSRKSEIEKHSIIISTLFNSTNIEQNYSIVFLATQSSSDLVKSKFCNHLVITTRDDKILLMKEAKLAIAKSGTNAMEFLANGIKCLVYYKFAWLNFFIASFFVKVKFANIVNIVKNKMLVIECVNKDCTIQKIKKEFKLIEQGYYDNQYKEAFAIVNSQQNNYQKPQTIVAKSILTDYFFK